MYCPELFCTESRKESDYGKVEIKIHRGKHFPGSHVVVRGNRASGRAFHCLDHIRKRLRFNLLGDDFPGAGPELEHFGRRFLNAILGSLMVVAPATVLAMFISVPVVFYMNLYRRRSNWLSYLARLVYDVLYGIPSIVYGAFAFMVMVMVGMRASVLGGIIVSTLLIIPMFIRSGDEISKSVPDDMIDAAYSLGATKLETLRVVLKQVLPGMATATLLAVGKAIGDAAAVMFTAGFSDSVADSLSSPTATLPLAIFNWITMPDPFPGRAYAAALVLTVLVLILSLGGRWITNHFTKNNM